mmetsp:Transcript_23188/g.54988  ORF Transcript_23188/g.54988 Transcript_23188/m.54988 type:complete len:161 (-) Transcript_23188:104-586(-)|eukprot:CAMPEP_0113447400 /NCGR_PEP_ID=MMETSP0014_2-20120614/4214_1 /TAXON_ID=2857 /ORGANISM="Nitzschia sp." /LENGTH=160 /DNA_ID=CAMNT_0000338545 /DNA_START=74 /DNA_END=556 /DNA_ORIENTATION=+ /assembly_acc=CAM_ASM_000159
MPPGFRPQVLNDAFLAAANQARKKTPELTHKQKVARLYRQSLKLAASWAIDRDIVNEECTKIRARFDAERGCKPERAVRLIREAEDEMFAYSHPDPYTNPVMPGGSKFMRNPPVPLDVCFPDGNIPADALTYTVQPDWAKTTPENDGYKLIDFAHGKNMS